MLAVRFRNGEIVGADALKESLTHGLGRILVAAGHLNRDQIALHRVGRARRQRVDHLLATGLVPAETLAGCVRQHTYLLLLRLLGWKVGRLSVLRGRGGDQSRPAPALGRRGAGAGLGRGSSARSAGPFRRSGGEVLQSAARRSPRVPGPQLAPGARPGSAAEDVWLTPFEDALLRSLDGLTPANAFKEALGVDEFRLRFALHRLRRMGLVEGVTAGGAAEVGAQPAPGGADPVRPPRLRLAAPPERPPRPRRHARPAQMEPARRLKPSPLDRARRPARRSRAAPSATCWREGSPWSCSPWSLWGGSAPRLHQPFPWQEASRQRLENLRLQAQEHDLIGKLKTYRILYGTFPLDLRPLVDTGLVGPREHRGQPRARRRLRGARRRFRPRARGGGRRATRSARGPTSRWPATSCSIPISAASTVLSGGTPVQVLD